MVTLLHMVLIAALMVSAGIFIPIFVVVESTEVAVTLANDVDKKLDQELTGDNHGNQ
jgi:hypothetical protein